MNCACTSLNAPCRVSARVVSCPERRRVSMTSRCLWRHVSDAATRSSARARSSGRSRFIRILLYLWATNYHDPLAARRTNQPSLAAVCVPGGAGQPARRFSVEAAPQGGGWSSSDEADTARRRIPDLSAAELPKRASLCAPVVLTVRRSSVSWTNAAGQRARPRRALSRKRPTSPHRAQARMDKYSGRPDFLTRLLIAELDREHRVGR